MFVYCADVRAKSYKFPCHRQCVAVGGNLKMRFQVNDDLYLTDELKQYYMTDFEQLLAYKKSDFWDIDHGLADVLVKINDSPNLQTIYSKKLTPKQ